MSAIQKIQVFEHERLVLEKGKFNEQQLTALLKLNEYHGFDYFDAIPNGIKFKQYVGVIQVDGLLIEILPKADKSDNDDKWQGVLVEMLKLSGRLNASNTGSANVNRSYLNLIELYFEMYLSEIESLLRRGLIKQYRKEEGNLNVLKGKLQFSKNIQHNTVHKTRFYTIHQKYDRNHALHQTLAYALQIVSHFSTGTLLHDKCKRICSEFPAECFKTQPTKQTLESILDLRKMKSNRKTAPYISALEFARLIILNYSPNLKQGTEKMIALLFDMNVLWEEFVLLSLRKYITKNQLPFTVEGQTTKYFWSANSLKPDIVIKNNVSEEITVIDTKWKHENKPPDIADVRQMYVYGRYWNAKKNVLLYPGKKENKESKNFKISDLDTHSAELNTIQHECRLMYLNVVLENGSLNKNIGRELMHELELY